MATAGSIKMRRSGSDASNHVSSSNSVANDPEKKRRKTLQRGNAASAVTITSNSTQNGIDRFTCSEDKGEHASSLNCGIASTTDSGDAPLSGIQCLGDNFYNVPCEQLAKSLLGKILIRKLDSGCVLKGRIVETECYLGGDDRASHSCGGKMTERNAPMFMKPGTSYVYFTYGMYHCFNISSQGPGAAVLIRALEPVEGIGVMAQLREQRHAASKKKKNNDGKQHDDDAPAEKPASRKRETMGNPKKLKLHELCNGPAKLCIALDIDKDTCNKRDLTSWPGLSVCAEDGAEEDAGERVVVVSTRVGIESAGSEWANKLLRFYLLGNPCVSKPDRRAEKRALADRKRQD